jgi:hypothetical protein
MSVKVWLHFFNYFIKVKIQFYFRRLYSLTSIQIDKIKEITCLIQQTKPNVGIFCYLLKWLCYFVTLWEHNVLIDKRIRLKDTQEFENLIFWVIQQLNWCTHHHNQDREVHIHNCILHFPDDTFNSNKIHNFNTCFNE